MNNTLYTNLVGTKIQFKKAGDSNYLTGVVRAVWIGEKSALFFFIQSDSFFYECMARDFLIKPVEIEDD